MNEWMPQFLRVAKAVAREYEGFTVELDIPRYECALKREFRAYELLKCADEIRAMTDKWLLEQVRGTSVFSRALTSRAVLVAYNELAG